MHLSTFFEMQVLENMCHSFVELQVHESKTLIIINVLSSDKALVYMDRVSTFHIMVIIYQSFNVKAFWKI
jgi:hypothetical protein